MLKKSAALPLFLRSFDGGERCGCASDAIERQIGMTKIFIEIVVAFLVYAGCLYFDIPVRSPPVIPGALLIVAMTLGYSAMDRMLASEDRVATTKAYCGGPSGWLATAAPVEDHL
jgi:XapX domain-containing protein